MSGLGSLWDWDHCQDWDQCQWEQPCHGHSHLQLLPPNICSQASLTPAKLRLSPRAWQGQECGTSQSQGGTNPPGIAVSQEIPLALPTRTRERGRNSTWAQPLLSAGPECSRKNTTASSSQHCGSSPHTSLPWALSSNPKPARNSPLGPALLLHSPPTFPGQLPGFTGETEARHSPIPAPKPQERLSYCLFLGL